MNYNGPSEQEIAALKAQYGKIISVGNYIARHITMGEFKLIEDMDSVDAEDTIVNIAVVWPQDIKHIPAGHISAIASEVLLASGFMDPASLLEEARERANQVKNMMYAFVLATQEKYTEEDLDQLTFAQLADKVALAEKIIEIQKAIYDPTSELKLAISMDGGEEEEYQPAAPSSEEWDRVQQGAYYNPDKPSTFGTATADDPIAQKLRMAMG